MPVAPGRAQLATVEELRSWLNLGSDNSEDEVLASLVDAASEQVERYTGRQFHPDPPTAQDAPVTKRVRVSGRMARAPFGIRELESATLDGASVDTTAIVLSGRPAMPSDLVIFPSPGTYSDLTGWFGFENTPEEIHSAVLTLAARAFNERLSRYGDAVQDPEGGVTAYFRAIPPNVAATLQGYREVGL